MRLTIFNLFLVSSLLIRSSHGFDCSSFSSSVCRLKLDNVVSIQSYEDDSSGNLDNQCQFDCSQEPDCRNFTFFAPTIPSRRSTCILFKECEESSFCGSCVSGPVEPALDDCGIRILLNSFLEKERPFGFSSLEEQLSRQPKQLDEEAMGGSEEAAIDAESVDDPREVVGSELGADNSENSSSNGDAETDVGVEEMEGEIQSNEQTGEGTDSNSQSDGETDINTQTEGETDTNTQNEGGTDPNPQNEEETDLSTKNEGGTDLNPQNEEETDLNTQNEEETDLNTQNEEETDLNTQNEEETESDTQNEDEDIPEVDGVDDGLLEGNGIEESDNSSNDNDESNNEEEDFFGEEDYEDGENKEEMKETEDNSEGGNDSQRRPSFFYCLLGGYGPLGPLPSVDHLPDNRVQVLPQVPPLPPAFPLGNAGMFGTMHRGNLVACSTGATVSPNVLRPFIGGGPFGEGFIPIGVPQRPRFLAPGQCYSNRDSNWIPMGGPMNRVRLGSSISRMGPFLIATGGQTQNDPNDEVEVLNLNKPRKWRKLSKIRMKNPTYDHCSVGLNKTSVLVTGGVGQGNSAVIMNMKTKDVKETQPMRESRAQHSCLKMKINGRPGVLVAGGSNELDPSLRSVEFFDQGQEKWFPLGNLAQGRRFPGIMVRGNRLMIGGGETTDPFGQNIILDNIERLGKRRWKPIRRRLPQGRSRFASIRVPYNFF